MFKRRNLLFLMILYMLPACHYSPLSGETPVEENPVSAYWNDQEFIDLQNPHNRVVVHCQKTESASAELCAEFFEKRGYVRLRDIPYKTADYDFLKTDTYPTRRWRENEATPRW